MPKNVLITPRAGQLTFFGSDAEQNSVRLSVSAGNVVTLSAVSPDGETETALLHLDATGGDSLIIPEVGGAALGSAPKRWRLYATDINASGNTEVDGTLTVGGAATFGSGLTVSDGGLTVGGESVVTGIKAPGLQGVAHGEVELIEGPQVTISRSGNQITISSSVGIGSELGSGIPYAALYVGADNTIQQNLNFTFRSDTNRLGIGTNSPRAALDLAEAGASIAVGPYYQYLEGRVSTSGIYAEYSLLDRDLTAWFQNPTSGERWTTYVQNRRWNLWSGGDKVTVDNSARMTIGHNGTASAMLDIYSPYASVPGGQVNISGSTDADIFRFMNSGGVRLAVNRHGALVFAGTTPTPQAAMLWSDGTDLFWQKGSGAGAQTINLTTQAQADSTIVVNGVGAQAQLTFPSAEFALSQVDGNSTVTLASKFGGSQSYRQVTVNSKGIVTNGSNPTTLSGYGITDAFAISGGTLTGTLVTASHSAGQPAGLRLQPSSGTPSSSASNFGQLWFNGNDLLFWGSSGVVNVSSPNLSGAVAIGVGVSGGAAKSILFIDNGGNLAQSNVFQYDTDLVRFGIGAGASLMAGLHVVGSSANAIIGPYNFSIAQGAGALMLSGSEAGVFFADRTTTASNQLSNNTFMAYNTGQMWRLYQYTGSRDVFGVDGSGRTMVGSTGSVQGQLDVRVQNGSWVGLVVQAASGGTANMAEFRRNNGSISTPLLIDGKGVLTLGAVSDNASPVDGQFWYTGSTGDLFFRKGDSSINLSALASGATITVNSTTGIAALDFATDNDIVASGTGTSRLQLRTQNSITGGQSYRQVTVNSKGIVTNGANPTTLAGYGITDALPIAGGTLTGQLRLAAHSASNNPGLRFQRNDFSPPVQDGSMYYRNQDLYFVRQDNSEANLSSPLVVNGTSGLRQITFGGGMSVVSSSGTATVTLAAGGATMNVEANSLSLGAAGTFNFGSGLDVNLNSGKANVSLQNGASPTLYAVDGDVRIPMNQANFAWTDQDTSTVSATNGAFYFTWPSTGVDTYRTYTETWQAGDWTRDYVIALFAASAAGDPMLGVGLYDNSSQRGAWCGVRYDATASRFRVTTVTTLGTGLNSTLTLTEAVPLGWPYLYIRVVRSSSAGTTTFYYSFDRIAWLPGGAVGDGVLGFSPNSIGFVMNGTDAAVSGASGTVKRIDPGRASGGASGNISESTQFSYITADAPPPGPSALNDEFNPLTGSALDVKWTTVNWDQLTSVNVNSSMASHLTLVRAVNAGTDAQIAVALQAIPAGDFTIFTKVAFPSVALQNWADAGLILSTTNTAGTGTQLSVNVSNSTTGQAVATSDWANFNTVSGTEYSEDKPRSTTYLRLRRSGTTYYAAWSLDGLSWMGERVVTPVGTPLYFGIYCTNWVSSGSASATFAFDFFRYFPTANASLWTEIRVGRGYSWKGAYSAGASYKPYDAVQYNGSAYLCIATVTGVTPGTDSTKWELQVSKGDTGATGSQGLKGDKGDQGDAGAGVTVRDVWNSATSYNVADIVLRGKNSYIARQNNTNQDPFTATTYWNLFAQGGLDGRGFTPRGIWQTGIAYAADDMVQYNGSTYRAISASTNISPDNDPLKWELWAAAGTGGGVGGNGTTSPDRIHVTAQTITLAADAQDETINFSLGSMGILLSITTNAPAWVRLYAKPDYRTADATRAIDVDPEGEHGCLLDVSTVTGNLTWDLVPPVLVGSYISSGDTVAAIVRNLSNTEQPISVTFWYVPLEGVGGGATMQVVEVEEGETEVLNWSRTIDYTVIADDDAQITLPDATLHKRPIRLRARGVDITISAAVGQTIEGLTELPLSSGIGSASRRTVELVSDGTSWFITDETFSG